MVGTPIRPDGRWTPLVVLCAMLALGLAAPFFASADPQAVATSRRLTPPSWEAPLGTDQLGRDQLARVLHGGRVALLTGMAAVACSTALSVAVGIAGGFLGGPIDRLVVILIDLLLTMPGLLVTLAILGILGTERVAVIAALVGASWAGEARVIRHAAAAVRTSLYVEAARTIGADHWRIAWQHVAPATLPAVLVLSSLNLGQVLLAVSALSFLGLGVQPPEADWGALLADSRPYAARAPWLMLAPGVCIMLFSGLANLAGDAAHELTNPRNVRE